MAHIGVDGGTWGNQRGYGRFTRELLAALTRTDSRFPYTLFLDPFTNRNDTPRNVEIVTLPMAQSPARAASADGYRSPRDMWAFSRAMAHSSVDLIFFPSVYTFVPMMTRKKIVVGIHDVIAERFPQYVFNSPRARLFWNLKTRVAIWQATRILTVSEHARRGIQDYFHLPPEKIRVTHEAPAAAFHPITNRAKIHAAFERIGVAPAARVIMCLGGITPHKNVQMLVAVFADLIRDARFADMKLVVAGDYAREVFYSEFPQLRAQAKASCGDAVVFTGYVDDETAAQLLNGSCVCVLPSFDEGFGLPGIEAAACGTPLIATQSSAMPELLGDAAIYIDPTKPAELRAALECVLQDADRRRTMSDKSIERASKLTWDSAARRVEQMFEELL